jgi:NADH dehydrogenase FAD-containing subunit
MTQPSTRILVIGAGYAGLLCTMRLAGKVPQRKVQMTLINESDTFTERLRLHQFAANHSIRWRSIPQLLRQTPVAFAQGEVASIDPDRRAIVVREQQQTRRLEYDYLVYALGSLTDRHTIPGVAEYAYTLTARGPLSTSELRATLPSMATKGGHVVICGGGPTGIETAAEFARTYPGLNVQLVTQGPLGLFWNKSIAGYIRRSLLRLGITITDNTTVAAVQAHDIVTDQGLVIPCDLCVWAGGFVASPVAREAGIAVNERNQIVVDPFMRSISHPEIYAIGDAAHPRDDPGVPMRMSAVTATILGAHGADCLSAVLRGKQPKPLSFAYAGQGIALGRGNAIGFNNYPADRPNPPYFTGRLGYETREVFVRYLAASAWIERRFPGSFFWLGKRRYNMMQRRRKTASKGEQISVHRTLH